MYHVLRSRCLTAARPFPYPRLYQRLPARALPLRCPPLLPSSSCLCFFLAPNRSPSLSISSSPAYLSTCFVKIGAKIFFEKRRKTKRSFLTEACMAHLRPSSVWHYLFSDAPDELSSPHAVGWSDLRILDACLARVAWYIAS